MPESLTKSCAEFSYRRENRRSRLHRVERAKAAGDPAQRIKSVAAKLEDWAKKWLSVPRSAHKKPPNKERTRGGPKPTSAASLDLQPIRAIRRDPIRHHPIRRARSGFALATLLACTLANAAQENARQLFAVGRAAFEKQDYAAALEAFEAALAADLSGPAVHFNIGVTAYRLHHYERAERAFLEVARAPAMAALAYYNLGLVEQRRGRPQRAADWFRRAEMQASDERLRELAAAQLNQAPPPPERDWAAYASAGIGYDDNVALVSDSDVLGVSGLGDGFAEAQLAISTLSHPLRFDAGFVAIDYLDLNRFDQMGVHGGARYRFSSDEWAHQISLQLAYSTLDGEGFESQALLAFQASRSLAADWDFRARYRFAYIDGLNEFHGVGGKRHEGSAHLDGSIASWDLHFSYELERSEHDDETLSATQHQLRMRFERELTALWSFEGDSTLQWTRYQEGDDEEEARIELGLALARSFGSTWRIVTRYARADNDSDVAEFEYGRNRITVFAEVFL